MRVLSSPWARRIGLAVAAILLGAALWLAARDIDAAALARALSQSPGAVAALAALVVLNLLVTGWLFWIVTRSFDADPPVGAARMTQLIALSALLNYVPMVRPGLLGRTAYLKTRHNLPVRQSLLTLAILTAVAVTVSAAALLLLLPAPPWGRWGGALLAVVMLSIVASPLARLTLRRPMVHAWLWAPLRTVDLLAAAARLWLAFQVVGHPIGFDQAVVIGAASLLVKLAGITPNGLGISEWAIAALAAALSPATTAAGIAAALIDRGIEILVVIVCGTVSAWALRPAV